MKHTPKYLLGTGLALLLSWTGLVEGGGFTALTLPATELTQLLNHAQLLGLSAQQAQQIAVALQIYMQAVQAGLLLNGQQWSSAQQDLLNLGSLVQTGQALAFSLGNLDSSFRNAFPGFNNPGSPYFQQYQTWAQTSMDTTRSTLGSTGLAWQTLQTEDQYRQYLQSQSTSAQGQMQAIQVGHEIALEQWNSLGKLRQLMLSDMQSKQAFQAYQVQKDMYQQSWEQNFFAPGKAGRDGVSY